MENQDLKSFYETGVLAERERILCAIREAAAKRTIFEALAYPYLVEELEKIILDGAN